MKYPVMNGAGMYRVEIPQLAGGINLAEPSCVIEDTQLAAAENVWWSRGALRTREALVMKEEQQAGDGWIVDGNSISEREGIYYRVSATTDGYHVTPYRVSLEAPHLSTVAVRGDGSFTVGSVNNDVPRILAAKAEVGGKAVYYFFCETGEIFRAAQSEDSGADAFVAAEPYAPLVILNGKGDGDTSSSGAVTYEGFNRLGGAFRAHFVTDGVSTEFALPAKELDAESATVELDLFNSSTGTLRTLTLTVPPHSSATPYEGFTPDAAELGIDGEITYIHGAAQFFPDKGAVRLAVDIKLKGEDEARTVGLPRINGKNTVRITCSKTDAETRRDICRMSCSAWFGGDRSGLGGGTRLFCGGHPDKKNMVCWSDVNNPLYFPENNYAYVGRSEDAVTAFGKQTDLLIVFKEHDIYAMQYVAGNSYTAADLTSGRVTVTAEIAAIFPITPLHPSIGCDCPHSVRLVNNRLVWLTADAHVYIMPSVNQWSERNVRDITARIRPALERHSAAELRAARAGEYRGYYFLWIGDGFYLLDAGNSAFQSYQYYSSEQKASRMLPWYVWRFATAFSKAAVLSDGETVLAAVKDELGTLRLYTLAEEGEESISAFFETKAYTFGRSEQRKRVSRCFVTLEDTAGGAVQVTYITDRGRLVDPFVIATEGDETDTAVSLRTVPLTPHAVRCRSFGLRFESDKPMAIQGIVLNYTTQGDVK